MKGYICRSRGCDKVCVAVGVKQPSIQEDDWFWYIPGWFATVPMRSLGIKIRPGEVKQVNISITESE